MAALTWLALAAALALLPVPPAAVLRARALAGGGIGDRDNRDGVERTSGSRRDGAGRGRTSPVSGGGARRQRPSGRIRSTLGAAAGTGLALAAGLRWGAGLGFAVAVALATGISVARASLARRRAAITRRERAIAVRQLRAEIEAGTRPDDALRTIAPPAAAAHAFRIAESAGVPLAAALAGVDRDLRARADLAHAVTGAVAGARASAALLAGLPVLGLLLGAAMGARPLDFLTGSGAGRLVCCLGVLLDSAGVIWTQRLVARAERAC
jgi:tight adherence protein B